uniref:Uncharacterized protein n=1 Tax=Arundo donax TaxID=35708 RepID=A0A0A8XYI6_ARUDO
MFIILIFKAASRDLQPLHFSFRGLHSLQWFKSSASSSILCWNSSSLSLFSSATR